MRKLLLATTALVASAGVAAADVTVGGDGRMGVVYDGSDWTFTNRVRVSFTLSGETDTGLAFGGSIRADNAGAGAAGTGGNIFISGDFGRVRMGDVDSAFQGLFGQLHGVGLTGLGDFQDLSHSSDGGVFSLGADTGAALGLLNLGTFQGSELANVFFTRSAADQNTMTGSVAAISGAFEQIASQASVDFSTTAFRAAIGAADTNPGIDVDVSGDVITVNDSTGEANAIDVFQTSAALTGNWSNFDLAVAAGLGLATVNSTAGSITGNTAAIATAFGRDAADLGPFDSLEWTVTATLNTPAIPARVLYDYTIDGFSVALGYSQLGDDNAYSLGASYTLDGFTIAAGFGQARWRDAYTASFAATVDATPTGFDAAGEPIGDTATAVFGAVTEDVRARDLNLGVSYEIDGFEVAGVYQHKRFSIGSDRIDRHQTYGLSASYSVDDVSVSAYATRTNSTLLDDTATSMGIGASYDLGGGASVVGGVARTQDLVPGTPSTTRADFGLSFSF